MTCNTRTVAVSAGALLLVWFTGPATADGMRHPEVRRLAPVEEAAESSVMEVRVTIDFARVLTFAESARTVIIGSPGIVDGTLNDDHTIVLTGKAPGVTNLIVLGEGGREVLNAIVSVTPSSLQTTTIYSGGELKTFSCTGSCTPILSVGDESAHFSKARGQIRERQDTLSAGTVPR
jgi:Flp pilus assembly secretin CpaC